MEKYIKKSVLVEWIKKEDKDIQPNKDWHFDEYTEGYVDALAKILSFLDTLEVKEADLDEEIEKCLKQHNMLAVGKKDFTDIAKHFFELGIKAAQNEHKSCTTNEQS